MDRTWEKCRTCPFLPDCASFSTSPVHDAHCWEMHEMMAIGALKRMVEKKKAITQTGKIPSVEETNMKLKSDFITQDIDDTQFLVSIGAESFHGIVRSNKTAAFIVECLKEDTSEEKIVDAMCGKYAAPREEIAADVADIINTLRGINALEE